MFPQDNYIVRCIDESFGPSKSSSNPMITLGFEIVAPDEVEVGGEHINVAGVQTTGYYTTQVIDGDGQLDLEKTSNCRQRLADLYKAFGLDFEDFNPENPVLGFKGKVVHVLMYGKEQERRKSPTAEQLKNKQQGDIIKNPLTGKAVITYQPTIGQIYGLAEIH
jgi:hypothetical protein